MPKGNDVSSWHGIYALGKKVKWPKTGKKYLPSMITPKN